MYVQNLPRRKITRLRFLVVGEYNETNFINLLHGVKYHAGLSEWTLSDLHSVVESSWPNKLILSQTQETYWICLTSVFSKERRPWIKIFRITQVRHFSKVPSNFKAIIWSIYLFVINNIRKFQFSYYFGSVTFLIGCVQHRVFKTTSWTPIFACKLVVFVQKLNTVNVFNEQIFRRFVTYPTF